MINARCKMIARDELKKLKLHFVVVDLGEVQIMDDNTEDQRQQLKAALLDTSLKLMDYKRGLLVERIKNVIIEMVHFAETDKIRKINFSDFLAEKLNHDYTDMSKLFSEVQGSTIEHFIIAHKVERIKELIVYGEPNITEIAWKMNYIKAAFISNQFKKVTGLSPSHFKKLKEKRRSPIEEVGNVIA